jgi:hypothetical protein
MWQYWWGIGVRSPWARGNFRELSNFPGAYLSEPKLTGPGVRRMAGKPPAAAERTMALLLPSLTAMTTSTASAA